MLETLKVDDNRLTYLPTSIGGYVLSLFHSFVCFVYPKDHLSSFRCSSFCSELVHLLVAGARILFCGKWIFSF